MPHVLNPQPIRPVRTYAAVILFIVVYMGVLGVVFAPKSMIAVQSGTSILHDE